MKKGETERALSPRGEKRKIYDIVRRKNLRKSDRLEFLGCEETKCENRSQRNRMGRSGLVSSGF